MMAMVGFADIDELRRGHDVLLATLDAERARVGASAGDRAALLGVVAAAQAFVERAVATGSSLDDLEDRTAAQVLIDYWCTLLTRVGETCTAERLAAFDASQLPELPDSAMPFRGLEAFGDDVRLDGREAETNKLLALVQSTPLLLVSGPGGCGKSSLVMGALLPALREAVDAAGRPAWRVARPVRPGPDLPAELARALLAARTRAPEGSRPAEEPAFDARDAGRWLQWVKAASRAGEPPLVVTIDQAEGLFTLVDDTAREVVATALAALLRAQEEEGAGHRVVLILREEFAERVLQHPMFAAWRADDRQGRRVARFIVGLPTPEGLRAAIVAPAQRAGLRVQPEVVDDLVNLVAGQRSGLKLLQHALRQLWAVRRRNRVTWDDYEPLRKALEADKWRFEAEHQAEAAERERAMAERERQTTLRERALARHERRLRLAVTVAVVVLVAAFATLGWYANRLREGNARIALGHAEMREGTQPLRRDPGRGMADDRPVRAFDAGPC